MSELILALFLGGLTWTLLEYLIHRWLGHRFKKNFFAHEHIRHHSQGNYFAPWSKKVAVTVGFTLLVLPLAVLAAGWSLGGAYVVGLIGAFVAYEVLHYREHHHPGIGPYGRWARRHHFHHHFVNPKVNHGVTSPLWDVVFGTYQPPRAVIAVPDRLKMAWLVDPSTGEVWPEHRSHYALHTKRRKRVSSAA